MCLKTKNKFNWKKRNLICHKYTKTIALARLIRDFFELGRKET